MDDGTPRSTTRGGQQQQQGSRQPQQPQRQVVVHGASGGPRGYELAGTPSRRSAARPRFSASSAAMVTLPRRSADLVLAADAALTHEPAAVQMISWMGPDRHHVTPGFHSGYEPDSARRREGRERRARSLRQMQAFLDDVDRVLTDAGVALTGTGSGASATSSPVASIRGVTKGLPADSGADVLLSSRLERDITASGISNSATFGAADDGLQLVSAFDGTPHDRAELVDYNAFVHARMRSVLEQPDDETSDVISNPATGTGTVSSRHRPVRDPMAGSSRSDVSARGGANSSQASTPTKAALRRPGGLPELSYWSRLPAVVSDETGEALQQSVIVAASKDYNDEAAACARGLMAHRCFRRVDFAAEFSATKGSAAIAAFRLIADFVLRQQRPPRDSEQRNATTDGGRSFPALYATVNRIARGWNAASESRSAVAQQHRPADSNGGGLERAPTKEGTEAATEQVDPPAGFEAAVDTLARYSGAASPAEVDALRNAGTIGAVIRATALGDS